VLPPVKCNCKFTALKIADAVQILNLELKTRRKLALFALDKQKNRDREPQILTGRKLPKEVLLQLNYILGCVQFLRA
jgi:hypothetical protein